MTHSTGRNHILVFAFLCAISLVFWWHPLVTTFGLALSVDAYTHILLIIPFGAGLVYLDSKNRELKDMDHQPHDNNLLPGVRLGAGLFAISLLMACYARWGIIAAPAGLPNNRRLALAMLALVVWWIASVVSCFGQKTFRSYLFPFCFLLLIVPIPQLALTEIVEFLQYQSALAARIIFRVAGIPAVQDGVMLSIPGLDIEVASECSSIRSSMVLLVITLVFAEVFLRSWWRKALLIAAVIPFSVAKNGLRIFTIGALGTRVDPAFLTGKLHHSGGVIFLGIAVVWVLLLLWILRRSEPPTRPKLSESTT